MYYIEDKVMKDLRKLLGDLLAKGEWYGSAFEIDPDCDNPVTGSKFEQRIKTIQEKINEHK